MKWYEVPATNHAFWTRYGVDKIIDGMKISFDSDADVMDIYCTIIAYCKEKRLGPRHFTWALTGDNVLTVNGSPLKRVGPKTQRTLVSDEAKAYYWEDQILARQEAWMD